MSFNEQLLITLIDKGLLALLIALVAFVSNSLLERQKAKAGLLQALASFRAEAYMFLCSKTEKLGYSRQEPLTPQSREELFKELTEWYYDKGGALFLSHRAATLFMSVRKQLGDSSAVDKTIRDSFSSLRTQLKQDCGIYTEKEGKTSITSEPANNPSEAFESSETSPSRRILRRIVE